MTRRLRRAATVLAAFAFVPLALSIAAFPGAYWVVRLHAVLLLGADSAALKGNAEAADRRDRLASYLAEAEAGGDLPWVLSKISDLRLSPSDQCAVAATLGRRWISLGVGLKHANHRAQASAHLEYLALRGLSEEGSNSYFSMLLAASAALVEDRELLLAALRHVRANGEYRDYATFEPAVMQRWQRRQLGYLGERIETSFSVDSIPLGHLEGLKLLANKVSELDSPTVASVAVLSLTQRIFDNSRYASEISASGEALKALEVGGDSAAGLAHTTLAFRHELNPVSRSQYVAATQKLTERVTQSNRALQDLMEHREVEQEEPLAGVRRRSLGLLGVLAAVLAVGVSLPLGWLQRRLPEAGSALLAAGTVAVLFLWLGATGKWLPVLFLVVLPIVLDAIARRLLAAPLAWVGAALVGLAGSALTVLWAQQSGAAPWLTTSLGIPSLLAGAVALSRIPRGWKAMSLVPLTVALAGYTWLVGQELRDNAAFAAMQSRWRYDVMMTKRSSDVPPLPSADGQVG